MNMTTITKAQALKALAKLGWAVKVPRTKRNSYEWMVHNGIDSTVVYMRPIDLLTDLAVESAQQREADMLGGYACDALTTLEFRSNNASV
jgi:hypothetical protein